MTELKNRGVQDIFIACVDGLKGFPEAIEAVFPKTTVQLCSVHMVRYSLNFVSWKLGKTVAADLRTIYQAATVEAAEPRLTDFDTKWGGADYSSIVQSWQRNWPRATGGGRIPPQPGTLISLTSITYNESAVITTSVPTTWRLRAQHASDNNSCAHRVR